MLRFLARHRFPTTLHLLAAFLFLNGCQSPEKRVGEKYDEISALYLDYVAQPDREVILSWDDASERLMRGNLGLVRAYNDVLEAREGSQRVFLDLLPSLNVTADVSRRLTDLANLDADDLQLGVFSTFSIPDLIRLPVDHYAALVQEVRSGWAWELARRERLARLRILFVRQKNLDRRAKTLELTALTDDIDGLGNEQLGQRPAELERKNRQWALNRDYDQLQLDVSRLLGDFSARWTLDPDTLPELYPEGELPDLGELENLAVLWRQLKAVELEGARLRELGVELNYWPDLSLILNSRPLYQRRNGETESWDPDDIRGTIRSRLRVDTDLRNAYRLRQLRRNNALLLAQLREDVASLIQRLKDGLAAYQLNREEAVLVQTRYNLLLRGLGRGSLAGANDRLESILRLEEQLARIEFEQIELTSLFWVLDESKWRRQDFESLLAEAKEREEQHEFE